MSVCVSVFPLIYLLVNLPCVTSNTWNVKTNIPFYVTHGKLGLTYMRMIK